MRRRLGEGFALAMTVVASSVAAVAGERGDAAIVGRGWESPPGVAVTAAGSYEATRGAGDTNSGSRDYSGPVAHGLKLHNCTAVFSGLQGSSLPLSYTFVDAGGGDCVSFVVPAPEPATNRRRPRPSPEALALEAFDRMVSLAGLPELGIAPAEIGLTGMPTYVWLQQRPQPVSATAEVPGLIVEAKAAPRQYRWRFGDATELITDHPGTPWTPKRPGSIAHTYQTKGSYTVVVEVVWYASYRVNNTAWRPLGVFRTSDSRPLPVRELIPLLVKSPRY